MTPSLPIHNQKPVSVLLNEGWSNKKASYWDIEFEDGTKGTLSLDPASPPPSTAHTMAYQVNPVVKDGVSVNRIIYPLSPQMVQPKEVVAPVSNPVAGSVTEPAEVKVPEVAYKAPDRDTLIVRQVVLKAATEYIATLPDRPQDPRFQVDSLAKWMEAWIFRSTK